MELEVLGSSSRGNCYILRTDDEILLLECGLGFRTIKRALGSDFNKVVGCLVTHVHGDHCKCLNELLTAGIDVYASKPTFEGVESHRTKVIKALDKFDIGGFKVLAFDVVHDCEEPLGFILDHAKTGKILFVTDTREINYSFKQLSHVLIEANYSDDILDENIKNGSLPPFLRSRIMKSHLSLSDSMKFVNKYAYGSENVVLLHLSAGNANATEFKLAAEAETNANVFIAEKGLIVPLTEDCGF